MGSDILSEIVRHKKEEIARAKKQVSESEIRRQAHASDKRRSFIDSLTEPGRHGVNIIAEIKRASPSKGVIRKNLDAGFQARQYEIGGAAAVSVLTDTRFFRGQRFDLAEAKRSVQLPVLRKEFIISAYQIYESIAMGADAVLLIVRILTQQQLVDYLALCSENRIDALVEVHSEQEFEVAARAGGRLMGINNRNLDTFQTDIGTCIRLARHFDKHHVGVAESGIADRRDIDKILASGIHNFLIGESLVRAADTQAFLKALITP
jgi:indole-3-glycerol phosphate synthase